MKQKTQKPRKTQYEMERSVIIKFENEKLRWLMKLGAILF